MKGKKNKKKDKDLKDRNADEKKMAEQEKVSNSGLNTSQEDFLLEIEEYAKKLNAPCKKGWDPNKARYGDKKRTDFWVNKREQKIKLHKILHKFSKSSLHNYIIFQY